MYSLVRLSLTTLLLLAAAHLAPLAGAAAPVARWDFGTGEPGRLVPVGAVQRDVPGPRPPEFPEFAAGNIAVKLDGNGAHLRLADPGPQSAFDFTNGDAITLEAWVQVDNLKTGENVYLIGKGRTGAPGFAQDNQNWALRIREHDGQACVSFLFATPRAVDTSAGDTHWHRWSTLSGFAADSGWHHVAVTYRFGDPDSIRGWIDGAAQPGVWDMGGATREAPVVDDDAIWIGSSNGGNPANSLRGRLDGVAIHREVLADTVLSQRWVRTSPAQPPTPAAEVMPQLEHVPAGQVLVTLTEDIPAYDRWLHEGEVWPAEVMRWHAPLWLLHRLPVRYDSWGIRDAWKPPVLLRMAADVQLPPGRQRLLLRAGALGRLWVNGELVARTVALTKAPPDGEEPITPVATPPFPGLRSARHQQQEVTAEITVPADGRCRVVLESILGGKSLRPEPGELCVAVQDGEQPNYLLLSADAALRVPLTDVAVEAQLRQQELAVAALDASNRRAAAASQDSWWEQRHQLARDWVRRQPSLPVPFTADNQHPIDAFIAARLQQAVPRSGTPAPDQTQLFHGQVLPILRDHCFRCHSRRHSGGLRLNSRESMLHGGDSGLPAVVPGQPAASQLLTRIRSSDDGDRMPPDGTSLTDAQITVLEQWIQSGADWPSLPVTAADITPAPVIDDAAFLRRLSLDTIGVPPTADEVRAFLNDTAAERRHTAVRQRLQDSRWADNWMGYWLDVLAENPSLINPSLNSTGPFRWFLLEGLRDGKAFDRLVTELIMLRGSAHTGGSAGFALAGENDAPLAAKAHILAGAFLGIELQCARCHDSPFHSTLQQDLYALSAMLDRRAVTVPRTSTVPAAFFEQQTRTSLIQVTLQPGEPVPPAWPFAEVTGSADDQALRALLQNPDDDRERLAALITGPQNVRFAQVLVNRLWQRFMGAGFVEPLHDWEGQTASHPDLLNWLAREFVSHDYDLKYLTELILTSQTYQRQAVGRNLQVPSELRFFSAPDPRRLSAEQVVDSLFAASGQPWFTEEITFNPTGRRPPERLISLGVPQRAWMLTSLGNERDRPSLSLPRAAAVATVMEAFGWTGARQTPRSVRETDPEVLQPGVLANSALTVWATRAADRSPLAELAVTARSPEDLVDTLFLRFLSRLPQPAESRPFVDALTPGFADRLLPESEQQPVIVEPPLPQVTFFNHLQPEANTIAQEHERRVRRGPPPDPRLRTDWRELYEDVVWSLVNTGEFVWIP